MDANTYTKKTNDEIKTKRIKFSLVSDVDVEESFLELHRIENSEFYHGFITYFNIHKTKLYSANHINNHIIKYNQ